ncbi:hypothetical protein ABT026_20680 [Streptomyces sp. NPDC002734]|uniref:hypothetical protein n=1 Tax=Streptomyces sp. NPDC002734 TaxID=3154426 RepID=UPI0033320B8D
MNTFRAGDRTLRLTNMSTDVLVQVLMLAVSDLAETPWDHRYAALWALQDQGMAGLGTVGFDLAGVPWGDSAAERRRNTVFATTVTDLAAAGHRWWELDYEPALAAAQLREVRSLVLHGARVAPPGQGAIWFPSEAEALRACCVRHRVLTGRPHRPGWCVLCVDEGWESSSG